jgi:hypothetical protein
MATERNPARGARRARQRETAEEPASVLAARQLATEAAAGRRPVRRAHAAVPIRPLMDIRRIAS